MNIVVIGASSGYGQATAKLLHEQGHQVFTGSRTRSPTLTADIGYRQLDATNFTDMKHCALQAKEYFGQPLIHAVVYCAGRAIGKEPISAGNPMDWSRVLRVNVIGLMNAAQAFTKCLHVTSGHFIALGSIASFTNYVGGADYCASKAAATSVMRTLRLELLGSGIHTTMIEPGLGDTNFQLSRYGGDREKAAKHSADIKQLEPVDVAETVAWLLSRPAHVNIDEIIIKPLDQANHGVTAANKPHF